MDTGWSYDVAATVKVVDEETADRVARALEAAVAAEFDPGHGGEYDVNIEVDPAVEVRFWAYGDRGPDLRGVLAPFVGDMTEAARLVYYEDDDHPTYVGSAAMVATVRSADARDRAIGLLAMLTPADLGRVHAATRVGPGSTCAIMTGNRVDGYEMFLDDRGAPFPDERTARRAMERTRFRDSGWIVPVSPLSEKEQAPR